ncbi:hypothetical protein EON82_00930 [bacterium]|nr:MAG: hypothetical protein EON82_00930 [bacterium]
MPGIRELLTPGGTKESLDKLAERTFRVTVKQFMDAHTFHEARIRQCCVHVGTFEEDPAATPSAGAGSSPTHPTPPSPPGERDWG